MRVRPPGEQPAFRITHSELFEASYFALEEDHPFLAEAYDALEWSLARMPLEESEPTPGFPGRNFRLTLTPRMARYPGLRVLIEVDLDRRAVHFWSLSIR